MSDTNERLQDLRKGLRTFKTDRDRMQFIEKDQAIHASCRISNDAHSGIGEIEVTNHKIADRSDTFD